MAITKVGQKEERLVDHIVNISLNGSITNSATAIILNDTANLPADGNFRLHIDSEIIEIGSVNTGNETVTASARGVEGTTAASHADGAGVLFPCTPDTLESVLLENSYSGVFSQESSASSAPNNRILDASGAILTVSDFTWVNQGTATASDSGSGGITLTTPSEASWQHRGLFLTVPTIPYNIRAKIRFGPGYTPGATGSVISVGWRQTSTGELIGLGSRIGQNLAMWKWNSPTSYSAVVDGANTSTFVEDALWIQIREDSTERQCYVSHDGNNWTRDSNAFWQEARTTFLVADQVGFFVNSALGLAGQMYHIESFVIEEE